MEKKIRKAIIPAAGLGTRFLPATKAVASGMTTQPEPGTRTTDNQTRSGTIPRHPACKISRK